MTFQNLPETLLQAFAWLHSQGLELGQDALVGRINDRRNRVVRGALRLASEVRDSAIAAEAAHLAKWHEEREREAAPESPRSALWLVAQCCRIVGAAMDDEQELDLDSTLEALRMFGSAVKVEPIESRVEAARLLREGHVVRKQRGGPRPVPALADGVPALRVV